MIWKYAVERLGDKFGFPAGIAYWRNKCRKEGIDLPPQYLKGGEGATFGPWKIKTGDQIEDWVKERLKSEGLISDAVRTAAEWELEINHLQDAINDATTRIATHQKGLEAGNRVKQRQQWLAQAEKDLQSATKSLDKAKTAVAELAKAAERHETHQAPVVAFEKQFQMVLSLAAQDLSKKDILEAARAALAKLENEVARSEATTEVRLASNKEGAAADWILDKLKKVWDYAVAAFDSVVNWAKDLMGLTKDLNKILDQAGAK